jgi:hypothetical protein
MLLRVVLSEMLDDEIAAEERLGGRVDRMERDGTDVVVALGDGLVLRSRRRPLRRRAVQRRRRHH